MILRVDRRPRAPGQRGDRQCGRLDTGLRRSFAGRAGIASDCEIRRPERQAMITVVVVTTEWPGAGHSCMRGGLPWPHLQRPIKDPTRCARSMPEVAAKPMPRRATSRRVSFSTNQGRGCRAAKSSARHSAAREPSCRASSAKPDPPLRSSRRNIGIPIGRRRGPACAIVESGWGWVISPNPRFECRFPD